ncbi:MAG: hypothetical protein K8S16_00950 [Bacteroidales bacterium]|nr:hypothetical protein [Bacteroidales bacterium]
MSIKEKLSKEFEEIYQSFVNKDKKHIITNSKEGLIHELIEISKKRHSNFIVENLKNRLIIKAKSNKILSLILYGVCCFFPVFAMIVNDFKMGYIVGGSLFIIFTTILFSLFSKTTNTIQIDFTKRIIKIMNRNPFGKIICSNKTIYFNSIKEIYSRKKVIRNSKGPNVTFNRIFISTKEFNKIPIIDLRADRFFHINDKQFISIIDRLIYEKYDK